jgi:hypothetical protein
MQVLEIIFAPVGRVIHKFQVVVCREVKGGEESKGIFSMEQKATSCGIQSNQHLPDLHHVS